MISESAFQIQNLLAFVSAVFGGFAIALSIGLLQIDSKQNITTWATGLSFISGVILILSTVTGTFGGIWVIDRPNLQDLNELPETVLRAFRWSGFSFMVGIFFLLASIGLSGFIKSRALGWITSVAAVIITILIFYFMGNVVNVI